MKKRLLISLLIAALIVTMVPVMSFGAAKKSDIKTYVFFGSDSRANDSRWKSKSGAKITTDNTGTQGTPRSDVIMLLRVNDKTRTIEVTSIYRDTMLNVSYRPNRTDLQKANKAYSDLGPKKACKVLEQNLDIKIDGYVATNFKGVANVIDSMDGVKVTVDNEAVTKYYRDMGSYTYQIANRYIDEQNRIYNKKTPYIRRSAKPQRLSGLQAVAYARVRYTDGADLRRSVRQRTVLSAMSEQYRNLNNTKKGRVVTTIIRNIDTNIKASELRSLISHTGKYKVVMKKGFPYYKAQYNFKTDKEIGGTSTVIVPCNLNANVVRLHQYAYGEKKYKKGNSTVLSYSDRIYKKTKLGYGKRNTAWDNNY